MVSDEIDALTHAFHELIDQWHAARAKWRDDVALDFERLYWEDIRNGTQSFLDDLRAFEPTMAELLER
jgi:hypothetical protein